MQYDVIMNRETITLAEAAELCGYSLGYLRNLRRDALDPLPGPVARGRSATGTPLLLFDRAAVLAWKSARDARLDAEAGVQR